MKETIKYVVILMYYYEDEMKSYNIQVLVCEDEKTLIKYVKDNWISLCENWCDSVYNDTSKFCEYNIDEEFVMIIYQDDDVVEYFVVERVQFLQ